MECGWMCLSDVGTVACTDQKSRSRSKFSGGQTDWETNQKQYAPAWVTFDLGVVALTLTFSKDPNAPRSLTEGSRLLEMKYILAEN